jgi:hypothetical protein
VSSAQLSRTMILSRGTLRRQFLLSPLSERTCFWRAKEIGCYLEQHRSPVDTWDASFSWWTVANGSECSGDRNFDNRGVTLRLTVCLGIEYPCGTCDQILFPVGMLLSYIYWGPLSDEKTGLQCNHSIVQVAQNPKPYFTLTCDSPNLKGQVPVFIYPRNRVAQLYPRALGSLYVVSSTYLEGQVPAYTAFRNKMVQSEVKVMLDRRPVNQYVLVPSLFGGVQQIYHT